MCQKIIKIYNKLLSSHKASTNDEYCISFLKIRDGSRFIGFIFYALLGVILLCFIIKNGFYNEALESFNNWPRFIWSLSFGCFGFSAIAFRASKSFHKSSGIESYTTIYPVTILIISCLVFVLFNAIESTSNYLYYFVSAPISFSLTYYIDKILKFDPLDVIRKK